MALISRYMLAFHRLIMPVATRFAPDLVLVSAGFDAAAGDPLGGCKVSIPLVLYCRIFYVAYSIITLPFPLFALNYMENAWCFPSAVVDMQITPAGYAQMTHALCGLARGKVVVALEVCCSLPLSA